MIPLHVRLCLTFVAAKWMKVDYLKELNSTSEIERKHTQRFHGKYTHFQ